MNCRKIANKPWLDYGCEFLALPSVIRPCAFDGGQFLAASNLAALRY